MDVFVRKVIGGGFLCRQPQVHISHRVDTVRIENWPNTSFLNLPKVRQEKRNATWLGSACFGAPGFQMVFANTIHVVAESLDLVGSNVLIRRHFDRRLYCLIAFGGVTGNVNHHIEEHLALNYLEAPKLVSLIYSIDLRLELGQIYLP